MPSPRPKPTQRDIARLAGVSQATVSLVLNGQVDHAARIGAETRQRVIRAIRETGYVADPIARRLVKRQNRILGVFTYEPVFPSAGADFYTPFLFGIEEGAEACGYDLLLFTGAPAEGGPRRIFHANHRLRLADGCLLLGRRIDPDELGRLVADGYPFVAIGRRDAAGGPVPYVGADYVSATAALVERAARIGHHRVAFVGPGDGAEASADRMRGFQDAVRLAGLWARHEHADGRSPDAILRALIDAEVTAAFVVDHGCAARLFEAARARALSIPADLSIVALGGPARAAPDPIDFTGLRVPRESMGRQAVELLVARLNGQTAEPQRLLPCQGVEGQTLGPPPRVHAADSRRAAQASAPSASKQEGRAC